MDSEALLRSVLDAGSLDGLTPPSIAAVRSIAAVSTTEYRLTSRQRHRMTRLSTAH